MWFPVMLVPKLLLTPIKIMIFGPKTAKFGPKSAFWSFYRYDTFIERSCEQLNIARRQQMNVEITAKIKRLICCDGHYPSTTRRTTFNYIDWIYHFS